MGSDHWVALSLCIYLSIDLSIYERLLKPCEKWWIRCLFYSFTTFERVISEFWILNILTSFLECKKGIFYKMVARRGKRTLMKMLVPCTYSSLEFILVAGSKLSILTLSLAFLLWGFTKTEVNFIEKWENIGTPWASPWCFSIMRLVHPN